MRMLLLFLICIFLVGCNDAYRADSKFKVIKVEETGYSDIGLKYRYTTGNIYTIGNARSRTDLYFYSDTLYQVGDVLSFTKE